MTIFFNSKLSLEKLNIILSSHINTAHTFNGRFGMYFIGDNLTLSKADDSRYINKKYQIDFKILNIETINILNFILKNYDNEIEFPLNYFNKSSISLKINKNNIFHNLIIYVFIGNLQIYTLD